MSIQELIDAINSEFPEKKASSKLSYDETHLELFDRGTHVLLGEGSFIEGVNAYNYYEAHMYSGVYDDMSKMVVKLNDFIKSKGFFAEPINAGEVGFYPL